MSLPEAIFEDEFLLVINKPTGVTVNIAESTKEQITVQHFLKDNYAEFFTNPVDNDFYNRNGIVHRIDKDTSGLLIIAKAEEVFIKMQKIFHDRKIKKTYTALVYDFMDDIPIGEEFEVNAPVGRNPRQRDKFAVVANGRESLTKFKIQKFLTISGIETTLLECYPFTGRTHQIRIHLTALNHPVAGDPIYSGRHRSKRDLEIFPRLMLHSSKLEFKHPMTKKNVVFESPLPQDMQAVIDLK